MSISDDIRNKFASHTDATRNEFAEIKTKLTPIKDITTKVFKQLAFHVISNELYKEVLHKFYLMESQTLSNKLLRDIGNLYDSEADNYNVKIQVGENSKIENFKAHSVILRARSNYFHSAFSSNWTKKEGD
ncbi:hypothetical protein C1645_818357 [Glomus cerebriforme]|uniref:BTB domain-containing protein n=1 Tax=Glomus cerebriforme TaxID=658196 RepID=A0A397TD61_9GLOM|nr:hypothetical protein C1645_818357 [Glomus cerebriforme]